jgi:hypothetical protein
MLIFPTVLHWSLLHTSVYNVEVLLYGMYKFVLENRRKFEHHWTGKKIHVFLVERVK